MNCFIKNIGIELKSIRKGQKITATSIYKTIKISSGHYSNIENARRDKVSMYIFLDISRYLQVPLSQILKNIEVDNKDYYLDKTDERVLLCDNKTFTSEIINVFSNMRKSKGYTKKHVAELMGVTPKYYGDVELGKYLSMSLVTYKRIAMTFDIPLYKVVQKAEEAILDKTE